MKLPDLFGMQMDLEWITARLESGEKGTKEESWMSFRFLPWMVVLITELKKTLRNRFRKKDD